MTPPPEPVDLTPLVTAVAERRAGSFGRFYDATSDRVFGLARRTVRDAALTEDVVQEAYLQMWQQAPQYRRELGSPMAWVLTIAHRRAVDRVRLEVNAGRRDQAYAAGADDLVADPADVVADAESRHLERGAVVDCMDGLTERQRDSLTLAYYDGLTYREVAQRLDSPLPTIKSRIRDGLRNLRDCLEVGADV